jgi:hypothetical protein
MRSLVSFALVVPLLLTTLACDNSSGSPTLAPATNSETFTGTVQVGGVDFHAFTVAKDGNVTITLTAAGPPATITMGLGIGTPGNNACSILPADATPTTAGTAAQLSGALAAGNYCVEVFDIGNQLGPITYSVTVAHP